MTTRIAHPGIAAPGATQAHVADAIAHVREAISMAEDRELNHFLTEEEPCAPAHTAQDAAVRLALLHSEDAMIQVLQSLPPEHAAAGTLTN